MNHLPRRRAQAPVLQAASTASRTNLGQRGAVAAELPSRTGCPATLLEQRHGRREWVHIVAVPPGSARHRGAMSRCRGRASGGGMQQVCDPTGRGPGHLGVIMSVWCM